MSKNREKRYVMKFYLPPPAARLRANFSQTVNVKGNRNASDWDWVPFGYSRKERITKSANMHVNPWARFFLSSLLVTSFFFCLFTYLLLISILFISRSASVFLSPENNNKFTISLYISLYSHRKYIKKPSKALKPCILCTKREIT